MTLLGQILRTADRLLGAVFTLTVLGVLLVGVPWGLWRFVGWPLPTRMPTLDEVQILLLSQLDERTLLNILACLLWPCWALFVLDLARCVPDALRGVRIPSPDPARALVTLLLTAATLGLLGPRTPTSTPAAATTPTAVALHPTATQPAYPTIVTFPTSHTPATHRMPQPAAASPTAPGTVVVRAPQHGIHDSLWRIAARELGDGARWPDIWHRNRGLTQADGCVFTSPHLIHPGWVLHLPEPPLTPAAPRADAHPESGHHHAVPPAQSPASPSAPQPTREPGAAPQPTPAPNPGTAITVPTGAFVGLGLAAAVSAALLVARRRYNSRYRPGSGDRDDLPVAPVVYQLHLAHLRAEQDDEFDLDEDYADDAEEERPRRVPPFLVPGAPETGPGERPVLAPELGVRDGREIALDLAAARGLGLVGAGAPAAARALLVAALTASAGPRAAPSQPAGAVVFVPADDLAGVLGRRAVQLPVALRVVAGLDDALDALEAETLVRAAASREQNTAPGCWPALVLVARAPESQRPRLQAVLDNGAPYGVTGLLLGQWQPGVTAYVREDGTISATGPGLGKALRGTRMFRLGGDDTADLLTLLHQAEPDAPAADEVRIPPMPHPQIVLAEPAGQHHPTPSNAESDCDTGLEVTAAVQAPVSASTALEILGPSGGPAPGTRLRPPAAAPHRQPAAPPAPEDNQVPNVSNGTADEVVDAPWPTDEYATTLAEPSPVTAVVSEVDTVGMPITITVLGALRVRWYPEPGATDTERQGREITGALQPRTRELLVLLALYPEGATREALVSALWGQDPPARPTNALHTALSRMRHALSTATDGTVTDITVVGNGRYQLDPVTVRVDYWRFADAVAARRAASTHQARVDAYREVINSYGGPLAEGMSAEWTVPAREAIRRDAIDAVAALARALVEHDPQQTLDLLEIARGFDPHNELLYRDIMRLQERLGQLDAIPRTLTLLTSRLAEIDEVPTTQTRGLATRLGQRHDDTAAAPRRSAAKGRHGRSAAS